MTRYLFFAVVGTALFWGLYRLLLRREHCLNVNRFFLLATLGLSLLLPLVHPQVAVVAPSAVGGGGYLLELPAPGQSASVDVVQQPVVGENVAVARSLDVWTVLGVIYWAGVVVSVLLLVVRYGVLRHKLRRYTYVRQGRFHVAVTDSEESSFSFFRYIVVGRGGMSDAELQQVLCHERLHAAQGHSWDRIAVQTVCCLLWFDPFVWLYERDLCEVHEYLADEAVLRQGDEGSYKRYLALLYCQISGMKYVPIVNSFHFSTIKKRITMMKQPKSHKGWVKALAALPVAALLLFANCKNQEPAPEQASIPDGRYEVSPFIDTYRDGQLVEREFMGVLLPLEELEKHKVFADSAEAVRFKEGLGKSVKAIIVPMKPLSGKTAEMLGSSVKAVLNPMVDRDGDTAARWYDVAWSKDPAALCWWNEEDAADGFALAEYPGGQDAMVDYVAKSIVYPEKAKADGVQGKVYVQFVVETDGSIADATLMRGIGGECDEEALRVVKAMPKWKPATFKGKPVRSKYVMPINFKLQ